MTKKIWTWVKEHWQAPFLVFWTILVYVLTRRNSDAIIEVLEARKKSYKKQIEVLNEKHSLELLRRDNLVEEYQEAVKKIEKDFKKKSRVLSLKQKNTVKEIILNSEGDSDAVRREIENLFNFTYTD